MQLEELLGEFDRDLVGDMRTALGLARLYPRPRAAQGWSWELIALVNQAEIAISDNRRSERKAEEIERRNREAGRGQ